MIRKAVLQDIDQVEKGYTELLLHEQENGAYTVWKLGVYPTRETAEKSFEDRALYVMEQDGEICASMILNQIQPEEYDKIQWKYCAEREEVLVLHLLCVRPSKAGCGIGKSMVQFAVEEGRRRRCRAVRLDTGAQNKPAAALYRRLGFELAGTASMAIGGRIAHDHHLFFERRTDGPEELKEIIRKAGREDIPGVVKIYDAILEQEDAGKGGTGWIKGVYPTEAAALEALEKEELFICEEYGDIIAAARINQVQMPAYGEADWEYEAPDDEIMVLHTLAVSPGAAGKGTGTRFVEFYERYAQQRGCRYLRMDTNEINKKARRLYRKLGYREAGIVPCDFNGIKNVQLVCLEKRI